MSRDKIEQTAEEILNMMTPVERNRAAFFQQQPVAQHLNLGINNLQGMNAQQLAQIIAAIPPAITHLNLHDDPASPQPGM